MLSGERELARVHPFARECRHFHRDRALELREPVVDEKDFEPRLVRDGLHADGRKEVLRAVLQALIVAEVVDARPRTHGPAIVELPEKGAVAALRGAPPELRRVPHALALAHLREVDIVVELLGQIKAGCDVIDHLFVAARALLMRVEDGGIQPVILGLFGVIAQSLLVGERLEAELAAKTSGTTAVIIERLQAVPYRPKVGVADVVALHVLALRGAAGRARDVRGRAVEESHPFRQDVIEKLLVPMHGSREAHPKIAHRLYLVISAPNCKTWVFTHTFHIEKHLFLHIGEEVGLIERIGHAGEHEVLPDHDAVAVAKLQHLVRSVIAAAPDADHVEVALRRRADVIFELLFVRAGVEAVKGDEVGALCEHPLPVDDKGEVAAVFVGGAVELQRPQPQRPLYGAYDAVLFRDDGDLQGVERLFLPCRHAAGPPKFRVLHGEAEGDVVGVVALQRPLRAVGSAEHRMRAEVRPVVQLDRGHVRSQGHSAPVVRLLYGKLRDLRVPPEIDVDVARDAARREHGTPVPPEMALRLPDAVYAVYAVGVGGSAVELALLRDVFDGRGNDDLDLIAPGTQELLDVELVHDVAVVRICDRLTVDEHGGEGVQLLAHQHRPVRFQVLLGDVKMAEPAPIALRDPKQILLVGALERVFDDAVRHEIEIVAGRDVGGVLHVVADVFQDPSSVQR